MIVQAIPYSFRIGLLLQLARDIFRIALYTDAAELNATTTAYTPDHEVIGPGYDAGGQALQNLVVLNDGRWAFLDWSDPVWPMASITARGALIYNYSRNNEAVAVLDLGKNHTSTNGAFVVHLPEPTAQTALVRLGG